MTNRLYAAAAEATLAATLAVAWIGVGCKGASPIAERPVVQTDGGITTIARGLRPASFVSDASTLFFSDIGGIKRVSAHGVNPPSIFFDDGDVSILGVDSQMLYVADSRRVLGVPKDGGPRVPIAVANEHVLAWTAHRGEAFWLERDVTTSVGPAARAPIVTLRSSPLHAGATTAVVARFESNALADPLRELVVTDTLVFLSGQLLSFLLRGSGGGLEGRAPSAVVGLPMCNRMVGDDTSAYCFPTGGDIIRIGEDGIPQRLGNVRRVTCAVVDKTDVYVGDNQPGGVLTKITKDGGAIAVIATEPAVSVTLDERAIYWETPDGVLRRKSR